MTKVVRVATSSGSLRGTSADGVAAFLGVPYATTGSRRFGAPLAFAALSNEIDATRWGPISPQLPLLKAFQALTAGTDVESEDPLNLNGWAPADLGGAKPVIVWCHGGAFFLGSSAMAPTQMEGSRLAARQDVVVVSFNHRLGVLGFLDLASVSDDPRPADAGNAGLLDMVAVLDWVRNNIASFGGDPTNVTIAGESGGGQKVDALLGVPAAQGLFHKAIVQSRDEWCALEPDVSRQTALRFLDALGLGPDQVDCLNDVPLDELMNAAMTPGLLFGPVLDGRTITYQPLEGEPTAAELSVPLLLGCTQYEQTVLLPLADPGIATITWDDLAGGLVADRVGVDPAEVAAAFRVVQPGDNPTELAALITTWGRIRWGTRRQAARRAVLGAAPVYHYEIAWEPDIHGGRNRSFHGMDVPLVFDNYDRSADSLGTDTVGARLAAEMSAAWAAFARTGSPNGPGLPSWEPYEADEPRTLVYGDRTTLEKGYAGNQEAICDQFGAVAWGRHAYGPAADDNWRLFLYTPPQQDHT